MLGFDYADVGVELMRSWSLADTIVETIENHLTPGRAHQYALETSIIHIANILAITDELGADSAGQIPIIAPVVWQITGLSDEVLQSITQESIRHVEEAVSLFMPATPLRVASG